MPHSIRKETITINLLHLLKDIHAGLIWGTGISSEDLKSLLVSGPLRADYLFIGKRGTSALAPVVFKQLLYSFRIIQ